MPRAISYIFGLFYFFGDQFFLFLFCEMGICLNRRQDCLQDFFFCFDLLLRLVSNFFLRKCGSTKAILCAYRSEMQINKQTPTTFKAVLMKSTDDFQGHGEARGSHAEPSPPTGERAEGANVTRREGGGTFVKSSSFFGYCAAKIMSSREASIHPSCCRAMRRTRCALLM